MIHSVLRYVMAGLVPAIHADTQETYFKQGYMRQHVDARVKHGHDELYRLNESVL